MEKKALTWRIFLFPGFALFVVVLVISTLLTGCGESDPPPIDICNDRSWDECGHIAESECGPSNNATEFELRQCEPYVRCENNSFDACMAEQER